MKDGLTKRQTEVLKGIGDGLCTKEIAQKMKASPKTVERYRTQLSHMFNAPYNQVKLARIAIKMGISSLCLALLCCGAARKPKTTTATLTWNHDPNAMSYVLYVSTDTNLYYYGPKFATLALPTPNASVRVQNLTVGKTYFFMVYAKNQASWPMTPAFAWVGKQWPVNAPAPIP